AITVSPGRAESAARISRARVWAAWAEKQTTRQSKMDSNVISLSRTKLRCLTGPPYCKSSPGGIVSWLMLVAATGTQCTWLCSGQEFFGAMLAAIDEARQSLCLETYIYSADALGERFREALCRAQQRGVKVRVLLDALGSYGLPASFWR